MTFMFETSLGWVHGTIAENSMGVKEFLPNRDGIDLLSQLYVMNKWEESHHPMVEDWVRIQLDDPFYGCPEYKVVWRNEEDGKTYPLIP